MRVSVTGAPLPSARTISALVHQDRNITTTQFTTMLMQWGQFLDHDITCEFPSLSLSLSLPTLPLSLPATFVGIQSGTET